MKCPKCQFENPAGAKFCNECGDKLEMACPACGKVNPLGSKFCNECGHDLKVPKEVPAIDFNLPQSYTPKFLADKILTTRSSIEGERKLVTVLFGDVANYTSMAEKLDPEEVPNAFEMSILDGTLTEDQKNALRLAVIAARQDAALTEEFEEELVNASKKPSEAELRKNEIKALLGTGVSQSEIIDKTGATLLEVMAARKELGA